MIEKLKIFSQTEKFPLIIITALGLIAWLNPGTFLWRDDWLYLGFYYNSNYTFFNGHLAAEIKPLFQYLLFAEFYFAGRHFEWFQAVNALALVFGALSFYRILQEFTLHRTVSLICTLLFLLHPVNFVNAFWIFGQCELLHMLFLLLSILYFTRYLKNNKTSTLIFFGIFLLVQNYFFPNGIFYPVLFIIAYFLIIRKIEWKFSLTTMIVFSINMVHAFYIQTKMTGGEGMLQNILPKLVYFTKLLATSIYRLGIPNFSPRPEVTLNLIPLFALVTFIFLTIRKIATTEKRNAIVVGLLGLLFSSVILILTRFNQVEIHYYYTALHFPYLFVILAVYIDHYGLHKRKFLLGMSALVLVAFLSLDFRGKNIFATRNALNKKQMEIGLSTNQYKPFDDPCFQLEGYIHVSPYTDAEGAVVLYKTLLDQDK